MLVPWPWNSQPSKLWETNFCPVTHSLGLPRSLIVKNLSTNTGDAKDTGLIPGLGWSPGVESGNLLQYSCLENSMDRGAWQATVHGAATSQTWLSIATQSTVFCYSSLRRLILGLLPSVRRCRGPASADPPGENEARGTRQLNGQECEDWCWWTWTNAKQKNTGLGGCISPF